MFCTNSVMWGTALIVTYNVVIDDVDVVDVGQFVSLVLQTHESVIMHPGYTKDSTWPITAQDSGWGLRIDQSQLSIFSGI